MFKSPKALPIAALTAMAISAAQAADPVKLAVGYQPCDTISYSAVVIRALDLWKKYLPAGSEVESVAQGAKVALPLGRIMAQDVSKGPR